MQKVSISDNKMTICNTSKIHPVKGRETPDDLSILALNNAIKMMEAKGTEASTAGSRPTSVNPIGSKVTNKRMQSAYSNALFNIDVDKASKERERMMAGNDSTPKPIYIISQQTHVSDSIDYMNEEPRSSQSSP